jgi:transposase
LVEGQRDAAWMADWARGRLRSKRGELRMALEHRMSEHQRWLLKLLLEQLGALEREVAELTAEIERRVAERQELIERLVSIPGVDRIVAWTVLAEIGFDMTVFEDSGHLASWAGLCPGNHESGGKRRSGRMRKGNVYLRRILNQAAWGASRKKDSSWESLYRRYRARMGHAKAIMALAHRLLAVIYHVAAGQSYRELGADFHDRSQRRRVTRQMVERLEKLGYKVTLEEPPPQPGSEETATRLPPLPKKRGRPCKCAERGIPCPHAEKWAAKCASPTDPAQTQTVDSTPDQIVGFS